MAKLVLQPISVSQLNQVHELIVSEGNRRLHADIMGFIPSISDIHRHTIEDPDYDSDLFLGVYDRNELVGNILGIHRPWKTKREHTGFIKWIYVRGEYRRNGIGRSLLERCEVRFRQQGCDRLAYGSSSPLYWYPGVPKEDGSMRGFLKALGWQECSERVSLSVDISSLDISSERLDCVLKTHKSVKVGVAHPNEKDRLLRFIEHEFSHSWAVESSSAFSGNEKSFCVYLYEGNASNYLGFAVVDATNPNWFGPMGIKADNQKAGLGCILLLNTLKLAQERGINQLVFPWVNKSEAFYRKVIGKVHRQVFLKYEKMFADF